MASKGSTKGRKGEKQNGNGISDERFAAAQTDPRFHRFPRSKSKVEIDKRFSGMFKDKAFQVKSAVDKRGRKIRKDRSKEDMRKYYRIQQEEEENLVHDKPTEILKKESTKPLKELSKPGKRSRKQTEEEAVQQPGEAETSSDEELDEEPNLLDERWARARGLTGPIYSGSSEDEDSSEDSEEDISDDVQGSDEEVIDPEQWGVGIWAANPDEQVPEIPDATKRLAIIDLDWTKVRAIDILVMLQSFLNRGQKIEKVTVYPSDYGLERMADESRFGPMGLISGPASSAPQRDAAEPSVNGRKSAKQSSAGRAGTYKMDDAERAAILEALNEQDSDSGPANGSDSEGEEREEKVVDQSDSESDLDEALESELTDEDDDAELEDRPTVKETGRRQKAPRVENASDGKPDQKARRLLQMYEQSRLRYYYAIVECADVETAAHLYTECNDMEFEHSANLFDLRFVPDEQHFSGREVRDEATEMPASYKPPEVGAASMLHTNPKLTWDAEDDSRKKALLQRVSKEKLRDDDFKAYLGSESDEEEEQPEKVSGAERYKQLLTGAPAVTAGSKDWKSVAQEDMDQEDTEDEEMPGVKEDPGMEMQVTFGGGLDELSHKLRLKQGGNANKASDTVWDAYMRRRKEKQMIKRKRGKDDSDEDAYSEPDPAEEADPFFEHEDSAFDDPFFKDAKDSQQPGDEVEKPPKKRRQADNERIKRKNERKQELEAEKQRNAKLEMLLLDESALHKGGKPGDTEVEESGPRGKLSRKARIAAKKAQKQARRQHDSDEEDAGVKTGGFRLDTDDTRFAALFDDANFALDPTDPRFATNDANARILQENAIRRSKKPKQRTIPSLAQGSKAMDKPASLQHLVASLKRKDHGKKRQK